MHRLAEELDRRLSQLDPARAEQVHRLVHEALALVAHSEANGDRSAWPAGYFERTAGALQDEQFDRPDQGSSPTRENW